MKFINKSKLVLLSLAVAVGGCKKGLDYTNTGAINPGNVWADSVMIKAYINDIHAGSMPGWPLGSGGSSDEGIQYNGVNLSNFLQGINATDPAANAVGLGYTYIDKANFYLDKLATIPSSVISDYTKSILIGQAKFWRAWAYWGMVNRIGGVPLILHAQNATNIDSLRVPRSKTSECMAQIIKDLDDAAAILPANWTGGDYGRINKVAALGLKGRILMWYASPLFNPTNDQTRWTNAYNACKAAVTTADAAGFGLLPNYRNIWYSGNKEQIMVRQYYYPDTYMNFAPLRPMPFTNGDWGYDQPILTMLLAYPKKDGSPMQFDKNQLADSAYNAQFMTDFYTNRDDRFYATVYCGGTPYPTPDLMPKQVTPRTWSYWASYKWKSGITPSSIIPKSGDYIDVAGVAQGTQGTAGITGFYCRKGLDTTLDATKLIGIASGAKSWFSPMRYAELLLNLAECANETGKTFEALAALYPIRQRAGIAPGAGNNYGITAASQSAIRDAIISERQVELAFEGFRFNDLRRWKRYDILNNQQNRRALLLMLKPWASHPDNMDNIMTASVRTNFSMVLLDNLDKSASAEQHYNLNLNHWFYALSPTDISKEPTVLLQNKEWGGTFDPLQ